MVDAGRGQNDAFVGFYTEGFPSLGDDYADNFAVLKDQVGHFRVGFQLRAEAFRVFPHGLHVDAAGSGGTAVLIIVNTVCHQVLADIGNMAVAVHADPFDAAGVRQPVDAVRSAVG